MIIIIIMMMIIIIINYYISLLLYIIIIIINIIVIIIIIISLLWLLLLQLYIYIHYYTLLYGVSSKVDIYKANPDKPRLFFDPASSLTGLERFVCGFGQAL